MTTRRHTYEETEASQPAPAPEPAPAAPPDEALQAEALRRFNADWCAALPDRAKGAEAVEYSDPDPDRFGAALPVADGRYRVAGGDWVFAFAGGKFTGAVKATRANQYGGEGVVTV